VESRNNGVPLINQAPKSKLTRSMQQLAQSIDKSSGTAADETDSKKSKGLFRLFSGGQSK
jgi:MinD-like ATPase involved in chromosome partitioning or flagellar assembly